MLQNIYPIVFTSGVSTLNYWGGANEFVGADPNYRRAISINILVQLTQGQAFYFTTDYATVVYFCEFSGKFEGTY